MPRKLPLLVERTVAEIAATRERISSEFETSLRGIVAEGGPSITCRKGCNNCCHHPTTVTIAEGLLIYRWLTSHGRWSPSMRKLAQETSDALLGLSYAVWLLSAQPCMFLDKDGACSIYPVRPMQCRTTFSIDVEEKCHPHGLRPGTILMRAEPLDEFNRIEARALKRAGTGHWQVPIATAVLFAEKLDTGALDVEQLEQQLMRLYAENA